jgi:hypothetical protein
MYSLYAALGLPKLADHAIEVLASLSFYQILYSYLSPQLSQKAFKVRYGQFSTQQRLYWNEGVVSLAQSVVNSLLALVVLAFGDDDARTSADDRMRSYQAHETSVVAIAIGYFIWHTLACAWHRSTFGNLMVLHGVAATLMCSLIFVSLDYEPEG